MTAASRTSGYHEIAPPPELRGLVRCFWLRRESSPVHALPQRVLPDNCADWIFDLSATLEGAGDRGERSDTDARAFAVGPMTRPLLVSPRPGSVLFGIRFAPGRWRGLLGGDADAMRDRRCDLLALDEETASVAERLLERLLEARDDGTVAAATGELRRFASRPDCDRLVERALELLDRHAGAVRIEALASRLGCSRQHLAARFRREVGLKPKTYAAVLRFQSALAEARNGAGDWADVAQRVGYSDQSHLLRDFRRFAGVSATRITP